MISYPYALLLIFAGELGEIKEAKEEFDRVICTRRLSIVTI